LRRRFRERLILQEDTNILSIIVEMAGTKRLCLDRSEIDGLFAAFFANPKVASRMKMVMYSLHADYLWLNAGDLQAARGALQKALEIAPQTPVFVSNGRNSTTSAATRRAPGACCWNCAVNRFLRESARRLITC
jgi:hypothetical protein